MSVLLIAEHNNKEVKPFTFNAITAASQMDQDLHVIVIGHSCDSVIKSISEVPNVKKLIHVDDSIYDESDCNANEGIWANFYDENKFNLKQG